jgi:hypothetical protein
MICFTLPQSHQLPIRDPEPDLLPVDPDKGPEPEVLPDDPSRDGVIPPVGLLCTVSYQFADGF